MEPLALHATRRNRPVAGGLLVLASALLFAGVGAIVKAVAADLPIEVVVFFRNSMAMVFFLPWLMLRQRDLSLRTGCLHLHLLRSAAGLGAMYCFFIAVKMLRLADAMLLSYTLPIFIPIIERFWLKEAVSRQTKIAVIVGFIGIALILKPGSGLFQAAGLAGLASGLLAAFAMVGIRRMTVTEPVARVVFYFTTFGTLVSSVPLVWAWETPGGHLLWALGVMGILAIMAQMCLTKGYSLAPAGQVGPFNYGNVVFAALLGWLIWGETMDGLTLAGAVLTCSAGIIATYHSERHMKS
ncbi:MAG: DMT family transporter [Deltaproteobacteria bacterium]|nr:DMT family transporter [Deltaproteobacteria bacterium]